MFSIFCRAVYGIKCKNSLGPESPQKTILRMRTACWISKATNIQSERVIPIPYMDHTVGVTCTCGDISSHAQHNILC
jgi:hypothetical protein